MREFFKYFLGYGALSAVLLAIALFMLPALKLSLPLESGLRFIAGLILFLVLPRYFSLNLFPNKVLAAGFVLFVNLFYILLIQYYKELQKPLIETQNLNGLPKGSYYLKTGKIDLKTSEIIHSSKFTREKGAENKIRHYFRIPIVTKNQEKNKNWLLIEKRQPVNKVLNDKEIDDQFNHFRSYYLDSLKRLHTRTIKFYEKVDPVAEAGNPGIFAMGHSAKDITILRPHYTEFYEFRAQRKKYLSWTILGFIAFLTFASGLKTSAEVAKVKRA